MLPGQCSARAGGTQRRREVSVLHGAAAVTGKNVLG